MPFFRPVPSTGVGSGVETGVAPARVSSYLLVGVPHHVLDVLRVGVEDADALVFLLLIHCSEKTVTVRRVEAGAGGQLWLSRVPAQASPLSSPPLLPCGARGRGCSPPSPPALPSPSQTQTLLSRLQVASSVPEGAQATDFTSFSCPSSVVTHWGGRGER